MLDPSAQDPAAQEEAVHAEISCFGFENEHSHQAVLPETIPHRHSQDLHAIPLLEFPQLRFGAAAGGNVELIGALRELRHPFEALRLQRLYLDLEFQTGEEF